MHLALRNNHRNDEEIEHSLWCCTFGGAHVLDIPNYGLSIGSIADLVIIDSDNLAHAVVSHPPRGMVLKAG